ncbi:MAG: TrkH family potassium uptake protein [Halanaerobiales bacterium]
MNFSSILNILGSLLLMVAVSMLLPVLVGIYYQEIDALVFVITSGITLMAGLLLKRSEYKQTGLQYRDGFVVVTMGWFLVSLFGSLPFLLADIFNHPLDAFFESVSGFTTTGATVIMSLESMSKTILFWRSLTHWLGGMGIILMTLAVLPQLAGNMHLFKAEVPGPVHNRIKPRIQETAKALWFIYIFLTAVEIILLSVYGVPLFDALIHSFGTLSTGGFSSRTLSVRAYSSLGVDSVVIVFMFIAGVNFNLLYDTFHGNPRKLFSDEEFRLYSAIVLLAIILISFNLFIHVYDDILSAVRYAAFQVVSISTTTGFATIDYDTWPPFSRWILLILMFIGGSAGSTAGGIKIIRIKLLLKKGIQELYRLLHPRAVKKVKINNKVVSEKITTSILGFFFLYITVFVLVTLVLTSFGIDILSSISAVAATLGNVGPGLELVGPLNSYMSFPQSAKLLLALCMMMGRLEIYTILVFIFMDWRT